MRRRSEDIDQLFRVLAEALRNAKFVGTPSLYFNIIRSAWRTHDPPHVETVDSVYGIEKWLKGVVYDEVEGITKARFFWIEKYAASPPPSALRPAPCTLSARTAHIASALHPAPCTLRPAPCTLTTLTARVGLRAVRACQAQV